jgi:hypothetical protein
MICSECGADKDEKLFATYKTRSGETRRRGVCWSCRTDRSAQYAQDNFEVLQKWRKQYNTKNMEKKRVRDAQRRSEIRAYTDKVKDIPCADCGIKWVSVAMDFDHVRGIKCYSIAKLVSGAYRIEIVKAEIAKCEVVCACCHRIRTHFRKENSPKQPRESTAAEACIVNDQRSISENTKLSVNGDVVAVGDVIRNRFIDWVSQPWTVKTNTEIANDLGVGIAVVSRRRPDGLPWPKRSNRGRDLPIDWESQPWGVLTQKEIAKRLGVSRGTVKRHEPIGVK